ncbi:MAG: leucine-rich repeat protein [Verrucomicrobiales bacterium]
MGYRDGRDTFQRCAKLGSIKLPRRITRIGNNAFSGCISLTDIEYEPAFEDVSPDLIIYSFTGNSGFGSPPWRGSLNLHEIDESAFPAAGWQFSHGLEYTTGLGSDSNGDGVDLVVSE